MFPAKKSCFMSCQLGWYWWRFRTGPVIHPLEHEMQCYSRKVLLHRLIFFRKPVLIGAYACQTDSPRSVLLLRGIVKSIQVFCFGTPNACIDVGAALLLALSLFAVQALNSSSSKAVKYTVRHISFCVEMLIPWSAGAYVLQVMLFPMPPNS